MPNGRMHRTCEALILRAYDVGEADRFCVILTREAGRLAVRASGARRMNSRLGASLLPLQHVRVELSERGSHPIVSAGTVLTAAPVRTAHQLAVAQEAVELLMRFTEDAEELPDIFDHCKSFLMEARDEAALLPFTLKLLSMLGVLPLSAEDSRYALLPQTDRVALHSAVETGAQTVATGALHRFCEAILTDHLSRPLAVTAVREALRPLRSI